MWVRAGACFDFFVLPAMINAFRSRA
jgi:hypothetical protein